ncbi:MAG: hypothetical protein QOH88_1085 [Verrucomicrobiota bacterium]
MEKKPAEAIRPNLVSSFVKIFSAACLLALSISNALADPASELASFSVFDKVDLAALAKEPAVAHGPPLSGRYISTQSAFVVPSPPARVADALRQWNPVRHSELKVLIHGDLPSSPGPVNFSRLSSAPNNGAVQALVSATQKLSPDLQISKEEEKRFASVAGATGMPGPMATAWADVLSARGRAGRSAQPPYDHTGQNVRPSEELNALLRSNDKISGRFSGVLNGKGDQFWELLTADELGVLTLGASFRRAGSSGTFQAADALYYASGGYYAGLTLYQMWPVDVGGKQSTLVWRGDFISSATIAGLHGIERVASESSMMRDISKAISAFRRDTGGGR